MRSDGVFIAAIELRIEVGLAQVFQDVCERWILERRSIDYVLQHLRKANFDPEFYRRYEGAVAAQYARKNG